MAMDDTELAALVRAQITDAIGYDQTELSLRRVKAIEYYRGELRDLEPREGWSRVTARDLSEHIGWIMPGLMRVFAASDKIVCYEPEGPGDEAAAKQATDYVNYVFWRECEGYRTLWNAFQDALMFGNGIIKFWWETATKIEFLDYRGLSDAAAALIEQDEEVEVISRSEEVKSIIDPATGQSTAYKCHDLRVKRTSKHGRLRIAALPPEEFLVQRGATSLADAKFFCHRGRRTRQSLIEDGYDPDIVMSIGADYDMQSQPEKVARWNRIIYDQNTFHSDPLMVEVEVFECYLPVDYDGDGHAEWRKIVIAGQGGVSIDVSGSRDHILANEPWSDDPPFVDVVPNPDAHIWKGRSLFDELEDVQQIKTVLQRQTLDNLYLANLPQREVVLKDVENPDEVVNPTPGGVIIVRETGKVREIAVPFVADKSYAMIEFQDQTAEKRTGVSRQSMALDPEALANQTATGQMLAQSASYSKIELYARNIAEIGLKRLFRCLLRLIVRYQDKPRMIRLRNQWVEMDPRAWNANMDAVVSVGLGSGSRDRDMALLAQIAAKQELILKTLGPVNPVCTVAQYAATLRKMVEASGLRDPDEFFSEVSPQALAEMANRPPPPDPKAQAEMARAQTMMQKAALEIQTMRERAAAEMQLERERMAAELALQREKAEFEREQRRQDAALNAQLKREEMMLEAELTRQANMMRMAANAERGADTDINPQRVS